jgi:hypothetical protein
MVYIYIYIYAKQYSDSTFFNVHKSVPSGIRKSGHAPSWSDPQMARPARACRIKDGESTPTIMALNSYKWDELTPITEVVYHEIIPFSNC